MSYGYESLFVPRPRETAPSACDSCFAACCMRGVSIELSPSEAKQLEAAGTELRLITNAEIRRLPKNQRPSRRLGHGCYELMTDCANLDPETGHCIDYANRPEVCYDFKDGGYACEQTKNGMAQHIMRSTVNLGMPAMGLSPQRLEAVQRIVRQQDCA